MREPPYYFCKVYDLVKKIGECTDQDCSRLVWSLEQFMYYYVHVYHYTEEFDRFLARRWMQAYTMITQHEMDVVECLTLYKLHAIDDVASYKDMAEELFFKIAA